MKRSDIRNSTIIIMIFVIVAFITILVFQRFHFDTIHSSINDDMILWSDTLTNNSSTYAPLSQMDRQIENFMAKWSITGLSLSISRNDSLLYAKGYGWADKEAGIEMQTSSIMRIASASKLVTAVAIMKLVEDGKLSLSSKVFGPNGILNDSSFTASVADKRHFDITVDHLLRHQGGFSNRNGDPMFNTAEIIAAKRLNGAPSHEELVKIVISRKLAFTPGGSHLYSNFGYMLLSLIIEKTTGDNYWDYVQKTILNPIGAYRFRPATNYYGERYTNEVKYYGPDDELIPEFNGSGRMVERVYGGNDINGLLGAGGWVTSPSDMARLVASIDKRPGVPDILTRESIDTMTFAQEKNKRVRGWADSDGKGKWTRTGTLGSTHAFIRQFPNGECWIIITNSGVWIGHTFSRQLEHLIDNFHLQYENLLPKRNLW